MKNLQVLETKWKVVSFEGDDINCFIYCAKHSSKVKLSTMAKIEEAHIEI